ncbi:programmed cell death protein 7-like [Antechinus flavipes]|uniref:programmed cell death protein 7-like n=1 Tax=Antechinus flavipes TaxID=38775 RepID=UPI00223646A2|nr:programmed cell death protein 7-like [Antechinus flavipes]
MEAAESAPRDRARKPPPGDRAPGRASTPTAHPSPAWERSGPGCGSGQPGSVPQSPLPPHARPFPTSEVVRRFLPYATAPEKGWDPHPRVRGGDSPFFASSSISFLKDGGRWEKNESGQAGSPGGTTSKLSAAIPSPPWNTHPPSLRSDPPRAGKKEEEEALFSRILRSPEENKCKRGKKQMRMYRGGSSSRISPF